MSAAAKHAISIQPVQMYRLEIPQKPYWSQDELFALRAKIDDLIVPSPETTYGAIDRIVLIVCQFYKVPRAQVFARMRAEYVSWARHACIFLIREFCDMSQVEIGKFMGGRDHGSIHNSVRAVRNAIETNSDRLGQITQLRELIKQTLAEAKKK